MGYEKVEGWFDENDRKVYSELIEKIPDGGSMAELGVAKGRSLCSVAEIVKRKGVTAHAIDTFEGTENEGDAHADAKTTDWEAIFLKNVEDFGLKENIKTHRGRTDERHTDFEDHSLDLIFIDADHSAEAVASDVKNWLPKLKEGGILAGHDFAWLSVREGLKRANIEPVSDGNFWFVLPSENSEKPLWSICLIARNEAKCLPTAIASLKEFQARGGEVCLVDTGSSDNTAKIARDAGWKVEEVGEKFLITIDKETAQKINKRFVIEGEPEVVKEGETIFDFASARNYVASLASNDIVSMMDGDEAFTRMDIDVINTYIQQGFSQFEYQFVFSHLEDGSPGLQFKQSKMYSRKNIEWRGVIHECLSGSGRIKELTPSELYLEHYQNMETNRSGYLRGLAYDTFQNPHNDRQSHYFGRELLWSGRPKSAIRELTRHTEMKRWPAERAQSFIFIGEAYIALGEHDKAVEAYHKAISIDSSRREAYIHLADHFLRFQDWQRVLCYARAALEIPPSDYYSNNARHYREMPHEMLYWSYAWLKRKEEGRAEFDKAYVYNPASPKYLVEYINFYELPSVSLIIPTLGRETGLSRLLASIDALDYPKDKLETIILDEEEPTVPQKVAEGYAKSKGEYIAYLANDVEMTPQSLKIAILSSLTRKKGLVAFHSEDVLPDKGNICAHFVIRRDLVEKIGGEIFDTDLIHVGVDNLLWAKCDKIEEAYHEDFARIEHHHFSKGEEYDEVYKRGWENAEKDRALLKKKLALLYG